MQGSRGQQTFVGRDLAQLPVGSPWLVERAADAPRALPRLIRLTRSLCPSLLASPTHGAEPSLPRVAPPRSTVRARAVFGRLRVWLQTARRWASPQCSGREAT